MIPTKQLTKNTWYFGVHNDCFLAQWTGVDFVSIVKGKAEYYNHIEEFESGFEPLVEVQKIGSGFIWINRDFNKMIYK